MPRKPRIEIAGYYHIINRGVEQRIVFKEADDYEYFEELLCFYAKSYNIILHNYCLMSNHYHLLIKNKGDRLLLSVTLLYYFHHIPKNRNKHATYSQRRNCRRYLSYYQ